ncbi:MAG: N-acetyltransferase [Aestuariibacter sp.]|nr:N-acetyltransferase [Aestuariibacter sp.]
MRAEIHNSIADIDATEWNHLVQQNNPCLSHEFLLAMEQTGCVSSEYGWVPQHIAIRSEGVLKGAMPLYQKSNGYGEFVFDHAWEDAYLRSGRPYYPKLVSAIPYTPATGQRLLCQVDEAEAVRSQLLQQAIQLTEQNRSSGFHVLFPEAEDHHFLLSKGLMSRHDCQFHWFNRDYQDFDHFLSSLIRKRRKNIRQERRKVREAGITIRRLHGDETTERDWQHFDRFYRQLFDRKWGMPTFNLAFFKQIAQQMPKQVLLVLADHGGKCVAGALMYESDTTLYGRHWGCDGYFDSLHFELCYYQGIDYCIEQGLSRFEPGAQGEHKVPRGFEAVRTCSNHWIADEAFKQPIAQFCAQEKRAIGDYIIQVKESSPYIERCDLLL